MGGAWYTNRHEVAPNTEILLEYKHREANSAFGEDTEYLLLIVDPNAPLYRIMLELPFHHLSAVPTIFFEGRFEIIKTDDMLSLPEVWHDYFDLDPKEYNVSDILDPNAESPYFLTQVLEGRNRAQAKAKTVVTSDGKERVKIRRGRRIKTK